jgi:hypothetical protein
MASGRGKCVDWQARRLAAARRNESGRQQRANGTGGLSGGRRRKRESKGRLRGGWEGAEVIDD